MLFNLFRKARRATSPTSRRPSYRPSLEALDDRCLMSAGWAVSNLGSGTLSHSPVSSVPDAAGNHYVTDEFSGTAPFGATSLYASTQSTYVAKVGPDGTFLWAKSLGGVANNAPGGISLDSSGNVYAV